MSNDNRSEIGTFRGAAVALIATTLLGAPAGAVSAATPWKTGGDFREQLEAPVNLLWSGNPLRSALDGLSHARQVAVLIDRRVDPGQKLDLEVDGTPLNGALEEIAQSRDLGLSLLGPVAYFGPPAAASRLRTLAEMRAVDVRAMPADARRKFLAQARLAWDDFATPRDILTKLADENGLRIVGLERVPHDLWAAADLPPLSLIERLTLVAVQFDLTFQIAPDGTAIALVPLPDDVALVRSYPGGQDPQAKARRIDELAPEAQVKVVGNLVYVKAPLEVHERLQSPRHTPNRTERPTRPPREDPSDAIARKRIDKLTVQNKPLGGVLEYLAGQLNLELRIDRDAAKAAGVSLDQLVSFEVRNVTVDELFREVIRSTPLTYRRQGTVVEIGGP